MKNLILVVDDYPAIADIAAEMLAGEGYCCRALYDGAEAIRAIHSNEISAIVSDIDMPGVGGIELASHARKHCPRAKVLLMSGRETSESLAATQGCEGCEFLAKPFGKRELLERVKSMMKGSDQCGGEDSSVPVS